jgi:hypothetical protein
MLVLSDVAQLGLAPALLGVLLSVGAFSVIVHTLLSNRKLLSRISDLAPLGKQDQSKKIQEAEYVRVFPPSQRNELPGADSLKSVDLSTSPKSAILKLDQDYRNADSSRYVFSGFSVGEIRGLGNFPDYAKLSGVPLPSPLINFNIDKAVPRPYRPFRWNYHQTMCTSRCK